MYIESLKIKEGIFESFDKFGMKTLIYSKKNSCGKSTYLRLLFYSLGYAIPAMKGIVYNRIETELIITIKGTKYIINRRINLLEVKKYDNGKSNCYSLPSEHIDFLKDMLKCDNELIIKNLLGIMYVDQEKGWTLLNRGTVIGNISFNIEELLSGLNNLDYQKLIDERKTLEKDKKKYEAMLNINKLVSEININNNNIIIEDEEKNLLSSISLINLKMDKLKKEINAINNNILDDKKLGNYIDSMKLYIHYNNEDIRITKENICNYNESNDYLEARKNVLSCDLKELGNELERKKEMLNQYYLSKNYIKSGMLIEGEEVALDRQLSQINFEQEAIKGLYDKTQKEITQLKKKEKDKIHNDNEFLTKIYNKVLEYAKFLQVDNLMTGNKDYILTDDLKSLSGAKLQKMVFAFKLGFLKVIEENIGEKLIMVLDSPKGKELDDDNFKQIMDLVKNEMDENQVIIASLYSNFKHDKKITIENKAIEERL